MKLLVVVVVVMKRFVASPLRRLKQQQRQSVAPRDERGDGRARREGEVISQTGPSMSVLAERSVCRNRSPRTDAALRVRLVWKAQVAPLVG